MIMKKFLVLSIASSWLGLMGFFAGPAEIVISKVEGNCTIAKAEQYPKLAQVGYTVDPKDVLSTYHQGTMDVTMKDSAGWRILPRSACKIVRYDTHDLKLELTKGNAIFNVKTLQWNRTFTVETPTAVAAVRGTQFWGRVDTDEIKTVRTTFAVREGEVAITVKATGETRTLEKGDAIDIPYDETGKAVTLREATTDEMNAMAQASEIPV